MDGWYVKELIMERHNIRSNVYSALDADSSSFDVPNENSLEDDTYLDLLEVESKIKELFSNNLFTNKEIKILNLLLEGKSYSDVSKNLNLSRLTVSSIFNKICSKISYYLGSHFSNEGYIEYFSEKYNLDTVEIEKLRRYIYND